MDLLLVTKNKLLNTEELSILNFDDLSKYIRNKQNIENIKIFLNELMIKLNLKLRFDTQNTKLFLSSLLFVYHTDIVLQMNDDVNQKMNSISIDLILLFNKLFTNLSIDTFLNFENTFYKYKNFFNKWKVRDSLIMIRPILKSYFELELLRDQYKNNNNDDYLHIDRKLKSIKNNINIIAGDEGLKYLKNRQIPLFKNEKMYTDVEKTVKKAFWDVFEENIENNKLEQISLLLEDIKNMINNMVNNKSFLNNLNENINTDILKNIISNNTDFIFIYQFMNYLIDLLYKLQPPSEDSNTKLFKENIDNFVQKQVKISKLLRYFFENYFLKLENINKTTQYIKKNISKIEEI